MKVALIGATGRGGSCILDELVSRGHQVTAIARGIDKLGAATASPRGRATSPIARE